MKSRVGNHGEDDELFETNRGTLRGKGVPRLGVG